MKLFESALQEIPCGSLSEATRLVMGRGYGSDSLRFRLHRFRDNSMTLVVQLTGGKKEGSLVLNEAAEADDKKAKRLRELAASLLPAN